MKELKNQLKHERKEVDDPKKEIERMREEQAEDVRNNLQAMPSMTDQQKQDTESDDVNAE